MVHKPPGKSTAMKAWLDKVFAKQPEQLPLKGKPPIRREKAYSADTGYVYQYFYEGYRESGAGDDAADKYVFTVNSDRASSFTVTLSLNHQARQSWQQDHKRELNPTEQYALVKMALFQIFDERSNLSRPTEVAVTYDNMEEHATTLDFL